MKKNHFWQTALFAGALLFGFTACSSDDNGAQQQNSSKEQTLTIALNLAQTSTMRTVETSDPKDANPSESAINDVIIAIFDGSGNTVKIEKVASTQTSDPVPGLSGVNKWASGPKVTVAAQGLAANYDVYVVANAPTTGTTSVSDKLLACTSKSAFEAVTVTAEEALSDDGSATGNGKSTNFVMLGQGKLTPGGSSTSISFSSTITLYRLVSKVFISNASANFTGIYSTATYAIKEIYLDNVAESQKFVLGENVATAFINKNVLAVDPATTSSDKPYLTTGELTTPINLTTSSAAIGHYFYAMPNASTTYTRLVVKGDFTIGGNTTEIYYPIYLNWSWNDSDKKWEAVTLTPNTLPYKTSVTREAKKIYANEAFDITLNIKTIGVTDPRQDLDPQAVEVSVSVAPWAAITQNSTFQ